MNTIMKSQKERRIRSLQVVIVFSSVLWAALALLGGQYIIAATLLNRGVNHANHTPAPIPVLEEPVHYTFSASRLIDEQNKYRATLGLAPLIRDERLMSSAQAKAQHLAAYNYWGHIAPDGTQPWFFFEQAGYNYANAGENLAYGFLNEEQLVIGWIKSPTHEANLRGDYLYVGVGIVTDVDYMSATHQDIVVAHYATPR